jgi:hypothetical protein
MTQDRTLSFRLQARPCLVCVGASSYLCVRSVIRSELAVWTKLHWYLSHKAVLCFLMPAYRAPCSQERHPGDRAMASWPLHVCGRSLQESRRLCNHHWCVRREGTVNIWVKFWCDMWMGWDCVSELRPVTDLLVVPQVIGLYEFGQPRCNDTDRAEENLPCPTSSLSFQHVEAVVTPLNCQPHYTQWTNDLIYCLHGDGWPRNISLLRKLQVPCRARRSQPLVSVLNQLSSVHALRHDSFRINFNIILVSWMLLSPDLLLAHISRLPMLGPFVADSNLFLIEVLQYKSQFISVVQRTALMTPLCVPPFNFLNYWPKLGMNVMSSEATPNLVFLIS